MPGLTVWKNQEIYKMRRDMDRLFARLWDDFGMPLFPKTVRDIPQIDLSERGNSLIIKAEIPGIKPEDLEISITDDILTIKGELSQDSTTENDNTSRIERGYSSFSRTIQLPFRIMVEDVKASYRKGVLFIDMPKSKSDTAREIKIQVV